MKDKVSIKIGSKPKNARALKIPFCGQKGDFDFDIDAGFDAGANSFTPSAGSFRRPEKKGRGLENLGFSWISPRKADLEEVSKKLNFQAKEPSFSLSKENRVQLGSLEPGSPGSVTDEAFPREVSIGGPGSRKASKGKTNNPSKELHPIAISPGRIAIGEDASSVAAAGQIVSDEVISSAVSIAEPGDGDLPAGKAASGEAISSVAAADQIISDENIPGPGVVLEFVSGQIASDEAISSLVSADRIFSDENIPGAISIAESGAGKPSTGQTASGEDSSSAGVVLEFASGQSASGQDAPNVAANGQAVFDENVPSAGAILEFASGEAASGEDAPSVAASGQAISDEDIPCTVFIVEPGARKPSTGRIDSVEVVSGASAAREPVSDEVVIGREGKAGVSLRGVSFFEKTFVERFCQPLEQASGGEAVKKAPRVQIAREAEVAISRKKGGEILQKAEGAVSLEKGGELFQEAEEAVFQKKGGENSLGAFGEALLASQLSDGDYRLEQELTGGSVIFNMIKFGNEGLIRDLEFGPLPELADLRRRAERFEATLQMALSRFQGQIVSAASGPLMTSQDLGANGRALAWLRLLDEFEEISVVYWGLVLTRARSLDQKVALVAKQAAEIKTLFKEEELRDLLGGLKRLGELGAERVCLKALEFSKLLAGAFRNLIALDGRPSDFLPGREILTLDMGFLERIKANPAEILQHLEAFKIVMKEISDNFSFLADGGLPGRLKVVRFMRVASRTGWAKFRRGLGWLQMSLENLLRRAAIHGCGRHVESLMEVRRLVELEIGVIGQETKAFADCLGGSWRRLENFHPGWERVLHFADSSAGELAQ